jgi:hypothetical protein
MSAAEDIPAERVWSSLDQQTRLEVVNTFRLIVKEMINEHFRFDSVAAPAAKGDHLCAAVPTPPDVRVRIRRFREAEQGRTRVV